MTDFTVTTLNDADDDLTVTGDLADETADGDGLSLREALILANANADADTVNFGTLSGTVTLTGGLDSHHYR